MATTWSPDDTFAASADDGTAAIDVRAILGLLWRARLAMIVGALVGLTAAVGYLATLAPTFTARAKILFAPDQRQVVDLKGVLVRQGDEGVRNQIEILRSTHLMRRVAEKASLYREPAFNPSLRTGTGLMGGIGGLSQLPGALLRLAGLRAAPAEADVLGSGQTAPAAAIETARRILAGVLDFDPVPDTRVIAISARTDDPDLSARVVDTLTREYIAAQLDAKLAATREATRWLTDRVAELKSELAEAEANVARQKSGLAARSGRSPAQMNAELDALNTALAAAATDRAGAEIRYRAIRAAIDDPRGIATSVDLEHSELIRRARTRARELAIDRAELAELVAPGHERLALIDAQIAVAQSQIGEEAERIALVLYNALTVARARERRLRDDSRALQHRLNAHDEEEVLLREHAREAEATRLLYETFLARLKETTQQQTLNEADAVVISPAERPAAPDSASSGRIAALGTIMGLMGGLGIALVRDRLQNTFRALNDIEEATGLPVIGALPLVDAVDADGGILDYAMRRPSSALAEAVRSLRTNLLSHGERAPQVLVAASSVPSEGKSTTSLLLAVTSAQMGKSTIIVDCDLRRPTLSAMLGAVGSARGGLRAVLDETLTLEQACLRDPDTGLAILPTRADPEAATNPADALASPRFAALLDTLRQRYEVIILDAPPTLSVTDARLVAQRADATFYCVKWDATPRETVLEGLREFALVRPAIAGVVVTMVDMVKARREGALGDDRTAAGRPYYTN